MENNSSNRVKTSPSNNSHKFSNKNHQLKSHRSASDQAQIVIIISCKKGKYKIQTERNINYSFDHSHSCSAFIIQKSKLIRSNNTRIQNCSKNPLNAFFYIVMILSQHILNGSSGYINHPFLPDFKLFWIIKIF